MARLPAFGGNGHESDEGAEAGLVLVDGREAFGVVLVFDNDRVDTVLRIPRIHRNPAARLEDGTEGGIGNAPLQRKREVSQATGGRNRRVAGTRCAANRERHGIGQTGQADLTGSNCQCRCPVSGFATAKQPDR